MLITKNPLDEKIIDVTELKKKVVIYVKKQGLTILDFRFDNITNFGKKIHFNRGHIQVVSIDPSIIKHKLKFDFQTEEYKFYNISI
jgi:hypothetical protein